MKSTRVLITGIRKNRKHPDIRLSFDKDRGVLFVTNYITKQSGFFHESHPVAKNLLKMSAL